MFQFCVHTHCTFSSCWFSRLHFLCVHLCVGTWQAVFDTHLILSKGPMCLSPLTSIFSLNLQTVIILCVPGLKSSDKEARRETDAFTPSLSNGFYHLLAVFIPWRNTYDDKSQGTTHDTRQLLTHRVYPLLPETCPFNCRTEGNTNWPPTSFTSRPL